MRITTRLTGFTFVALASLAVAAGCDDKADTTAPPSTPQAQQQQAAPKPATQPLIPQVAMIDWCREHAVPESICTRCNDSLVAAFKAKNDWCKEHGLPESQCFECHPELKEQFAAAYKARYGKEPPPIEKETDEEKKR